jgi:hypothetical protein
MVGLITKTLKDGAGDEFDGYFYDDGTALYQASVIWDAANSELVDFNAVSPVKVDQTTRGTTNAVVPLSAQTIASAQVSVGTTATSISAARTGRRSITIINEGTTVVRLGASGVTTSTGAYLAGVAGASITLETEAAVYGIVGSGTAAVSVIENY